MAVESLTIRSLLWRCANESEQAQRSPKSTGSLMQVEYFIDLVFRSPETLAPLHDQLSRQALLAVKAEQVSTFLGKMLTPQVAAERLALHRSHRRHLYQAPLWLLFGQAL
jgi:hypothetical protein